MKWLTVGRDNKIWIKQKIMKDLRREIQLNHHEMSPKRKSQSENRVLRWSLKQGSVFHPLISPAARSKVCLISQRQGHTSLGVGMIRRAPSEGLCVRSFSTSSTLSPTARGSGRCSFKGISKIYPEADRQSDHYITSFYSKMWKKNRFISSLLKSVWISMLV